MRSQKNTAQIIVASTFNNTEEAVADDLVANTVGIQVVTDASSTLAPGRLFNSETAAVTGDAFNFIIPRSDGSKEVSEIIQWDNIESVTKYLYIGGNTQQVDYVGYNAATATGEIDPVASTGYSVLINLIGNTMNTFAQDLKLNPTYQSGASTSQYAIASGLLTNAVNSLKYERKAYVPFKFEIVSSVAGVDTAGGTVSVVKNSKFIEILETVATDDAGLYNTDVEIAAGDYIRFVGAAGTKTSAVYKVVSITGASSAKATIELDRPFTGATAATMAANAVSVILAATANAGDFGLKISGVDTGSAVGYIDTELTRFYTSISNCGDTTLSRSAVAGVEDPGRTAAVAQLEAELSGAKGVEYRNSPQYEIPKTNFAISVGENGYDLVHIKFHKDHVGQFGDALKIPNELIIALGESNDVTTNFLTALGKS